MPFKQVMYILIVLLMLFSDQQTRNKRVLEIYAHSATDSAYQGQLKILSAGEQGLKERDVVVKKYIIYNHNSSRFKEMSADTHFIVVLTGKDGGEKYRSDQPVSLQKLYALIDAMPMRKEEMKKAEKQRR